MRKQRKIKPIEDRFWKKVLIDSQEECWLWTAATQNGYGILGKGRGGEGTILAHRLSWILKNGAIPEGLCVLHRCDTPTCCNPNHLFLGTLADNNQDKAKKGRSLRGETHNLVQLTEEQVIHIRKLWSEGGKTQQEIANQFNTNKANVSQIVRGKKWKHLLPANWTPPVPQKWSKAR